MGKAHEMRNVYGFLYGLPGSHGNRKNSASDLQRAPSSSAGEAALFMRPANGTVTPRMPLWAFSSPHPRFLGTAIKKAHTTIRPGTSHFTTCTNPNHQNPNPHASNQ